MRFRNRRFRVLVFGVAILAFVSGAWALMSEGTAPVTFSVELDGEQLSTAMGYKFDAAIVNANKREQYNEYTLRISLALRDNPAPAVAFQNGQTFASAKINLLGTDSAVLGTYELGNATVVGYRQSGDAATNSFDQELVLKSRTLAISGP